MRKTRDMVVAKNSFMKSSHAMSAIAAATLSFTMLATPTLGQDVAVDDVAAEAAEAVADVAVQDSTAQALADVAAGTRTIVGEEYTPTIWVDPDGCEHWVFDDGFEGFMSPHRNRDGSPVCRRQEACGVVPTDTLFANDEPWIPENRKAQLMDYFAGLGAFGVLIHGHTDANASDEYNLRLSQRRADMVAGIALDAGVNVVESRGFGERLPAQLGTSSAAFAANRRVEIICLK
jgi:outer membrane protein OmpA-like peptidoglycan-associated protein